MHSKVPPDFNFANKDVRETYWHTSAHILAQAVKELFPRARLGIGPPTEDGFFYDFALNDKTFTPADLTRIEKQILEIIKRDLPLKKEELLKKEAIALFKKRDETLKVELLETLKDSKVTVYWQGDFVDLCRGPHLKSTGTVKHLKLLSSGAAHWRGEKYPRLQRIHGIAFPEKVMLDEYLKLQEEAKKRDHRKLGKELDLFSSWEEVGAGLILWHPKGAYIRRKIEDFWVAEHLKRGYELVYSPHIGRSRLWGISGHLDFFKENMYAPFVLDQEEYYLKPMNCPFHIYIYKNKVRSYRDLPIRYAELGTVYRYERSGVLHGLVRVRGFTQDDAHIFCRPDQVEGEIEGILEFVHYLLRSFKLAEWKIYLSTKPEKAIGEETMWEQATDSLIKALKHNKLDYQLKEGEGAFYGPKIDLHIVDSLKHEWQCSTFQFDFNLPEKFDINFTDKDGKLKRPYMVHRAMLGSLERFVGLLIEHYGGTFPIWLAPVQVAILPVNQNFISYGKQVWSKLDEAGIQVFLDEKPETISYKIARAEREKIPYMLVIGAREETEQTVAVRKHQKGNLGSFALEDFIKMLGEEITNKL